MRRRIAEGTRQLSAYIQIDAKHVNRKRLAAHNSGQSIHTAKDKPWRLITCIAFSDAAKAIAFERYLKSASGRAFANKTIAVS